MKLTDKPFFLLATTLLFIISCENRFHSLNKAELAREVSSTENSQNDTNETTEEETQEEQEEEETSPTPKPEPPTPTPPSSPKAEIPKGPVKVFPDAEGFGTDSKAGRGGQVLKVTNLNDKGPGSLRAAVETSGPRTVVFEVSGTIELSSEIEISKPYITIAGQTAPSPGITLKGAGVIFTAEHALLQHIRIRVGDLPQGPSPGSRDAISILASNIVVDHVSASWGVDEVCSTWYPIKNITISHSICSEGLDNSIHPLGAHSKGVLIGDDTQNFTFKNNLTAHNIERNILLKDNTSGVIANNIFYNAYKSYTQLVSFDSNKPVKVSIIGNRFLSGPDTDLNGAVGIDVYEGSGLIQHQLYSSDNQALNIPLIFNYAKVYEVSTPPIPFNNLSLVSSNDVMTSVLQQVGARPMDRDTVDKRIVKDVLNGTGKIIDSQKEVGGWPTLKENKREFKVPQNPNGDDNNNGYTNLEEEIYQHTVCVEKGMHCP